MHPKNGGILHLLQCKLQKSIFYFGGGHSNNHCAHSLRTCIDGKKINWPNGQSNQENKIIVIKNI